MLVGTHAEVLECLTSVLGTSEEDSVGASWRSLRKLVKSEALTTGSSDASTGGSSEPQSSNGDLGDLVKTVVIGDGTNNNDGLSCVGLCAVLVCGSGDDTADGNGRSVDLGHVEAAEDGCVELGVGTACICYSQP